MALESVQAIKLLRSLSTEPHSTLPANMGNSDSIIASHMPMQGVRNVGNYPNQSGGISNSSQQDGSDLESDISDAGGISESEQHDLSNFSSTTHAAASTKDSSKKRRSKHHDKKHKKKDVSSSSGSGSSSSSDGGESDATDRDAQDQDSDAQNMTSTLAGGEDEVGVGRDKKKSEKREPELTSAQQLEAVFNKFQEFSIRRFFPKTLEHPMDSITKNQSVHKMERRDKMVLDPVNTAIEENIQKLFDSQAESESNHIDNLQGYDIGKVKGSLISYVTQNDQQSATLPTTSTYHVQRSEGYRTRENKRNRKGFVFDPEVENMILNFYPHLLNAMKALMVYTSQNIEKSKLVESDYERHAYNAWQEVFSNLKAIQMVIAHAMGHGKFKTKHYPYPINFLDVIKAREDQLKVLNQEMSHRSRKILELDRKIQKRNDKIRKINEKYNNVDKEKADLEATLLALHSQINLVDNPVEIAAHNCHLLRPKDEDSNEDSE